MKRQDKTFFVQNLTEELKTATSVVLIDFAGMNVKTQQELKKRLKEVNAKLIVVKNTLYKLAATKAKSPKETLSNEVLSGQTALIITEEDPIAPLSILGKFTKEFEVPQVKVGIVESTFQNHEALVALSKLVSKDALLGQFISTVGAPLYGLTGVLNAPIQKLLYILDEASKKSE